MNKLKIIRALFALTLCLLLQLSCLKGKMTITKLNPYFEVSNIDTAQQKYVFFLVKNYEAGNEQNFKEIKEFAERNLEQTYGHYAIYDILFYKESSKTNDDYKESPSDLLAWHGDDLIFSFTWSYGKFSYYNEYKNGKIVNPAK
jgi:hypothetical protein